MASAESWSRGTGYLGIAGVMTHKSNDGSNSISTQCKIFRWIDHHSLISNSFALLSYFEV